MPPSSALRRTLSFGSAVLVAVVAAACTSTAYPSPAIQERTVTYHHVDIGDTTLNVAVTGEGPAVLLIHGAGEDAAMLAGQAESIAAKGFQVISYDRRGTGASGKDNWPGNGADQHADDAAALLDMLKLDTATVLGFSSGGVIALAVAARHPDKVTQVLAWEPPALGVLPDGREISDAIMAPALEHLADHPDDYVGAQAILLTLILGFLVTPDDPAFAATRVNAESMIRDDPQITLRPFTADDLRDRPVTIAVGSTPLDLISAAAQEISAWTGEPVRTVQADHEVYLSEPEVLTSLLTSTT